MGTGLVETPFGKCVFLKRIFLNPVPNNTSNNEDHAPVNCVFILLRVDGYRCEDKFSLQKSANNVEIAKRLTSTFPHPYTEKNAASWIEFTMVKKEHQEIPENFILPIVVVAGTEMNEKKLYKIPSPTVILDNISFVTYSETDSCRPLNDDEKYFLRRITNIQAVIGNISITKSEHMIHIDTISKNMEAKQDIFGYWLAEEWWGKGIMKLAAIAFLRVAYQVYCSLPNFKLYGHVEEGNVASWRVFEACGFLSTHKVSFKPHVTRDPEQKLLPAQEFELSINQLVKL